MAILEEIYRRYYRSFCKYADEGPNDRDTKIYIPIDIELIAKRFQVDPDIIFGRLHYSLEKRYGRKNDDGSSTPFFALAVGNDVRAVNFPMLGSVLAEMRNERRRYRLGVWLAVIAILISTVSLAVSLTHKNLEFPTDTRTTK